jgi:hypothetical protein
VEDSPTSISLARQNGAGCIVAVGKTGAASDLLKMADYFIEDFTKFEPAWLHHKTSVK